jgi:hypothetical protein
MGMLTLASQAIPSTPSSGNANIFVHSNNKRLYCMDDTGLLNPIDSGILATTANVTVTAAATTTIAGGATTPVPLNSLQAGSTFKVTIIGSFTGTATATAFRVHLGTAGTNSDAIIFTASVTGAIGTAQAWIEIIFTIRTTGASGTLQGTMVVHQNSATGVANAALSVVAGTTTTAPNTTVNNFMTISVLSAASGSSGTVQNVVVERLN